MSDLKMKVKYSLHSYETDAAGKMSATSLFNYLQDIAGRHAESLHFGKDDLDNEDCFWVLSRIFVEMDHMPGWGSEIVISTWPRGIEGIFAIRDFEIADSKGDLIGRASSSWLVVDKKTRRPRRPESMVGGLLENTLPASSTGRSAVKLEVPDHYDYDTPLFSVKYSDLDINMHVNNVKYIQWALDAYPLDFRLANEIAAVEVNYLSESLPGDELCVQLCQLDDNNYLHSLVRRIDDRELCRISVTWRKSDKHFLNNNVS